MSLRHLKKDQRNLILGPGSMKIGGQRKLQPMQYIWQELTRSETSIIMTLNIIKKQNMYSLLHHVTRCLRHALMASWKQLLFYFPQNITWSISQKS